MLAAFLTAPQPLLCRDPLVVEVLSVQLSPVGAGQALAVVHVPCCCHKDLIRP